MSVARALMGLCLVAAACRGSAEGAPRKLEAGAPQEAAERREDPSIVVHDCTGLEPTLAAPCAPTPGPGDALIERAEWLTEIPARHFPPDDEWWSGITSALTKAEGARVEALRPSERASLQNAALFLALAASRDAQHHEDKPESARRRTLLTRRAIALVKRLAFPVEARPIEGDVDPALQAWLGPRATWVERAREGGPAFHGSVHDNTRFFRLVSTPSLRSNFSQLVAVDVHGEPFVTSVTGSLEVRRGFTRAASACVALASAELIRCGASAGLAGVRDVSTLPRSHFFDRDETHRLRCNGCHADGNAFVGVRDLAEGAASADLAARRATLLGNLRAELAPLWNEP